MFGWGGWGEMGEVGVGLGVTRGVGGGDAFWSEFLSSGNLLGKLEDRK